MQGSIANTANQQSQQKLNQTGQSTSNANLQGSTGAIPNQSQAQGGQAQGSQSQGGQPQSQNQISNQSTTGQKPGDDQVKKVQTKFQSVSLREYYDSSNLTLVITKGLEELGRQRPANPIRFLGNFLLDHDPEK